MGRTALTERMVLTGKTAMTERMVLTERTALTATTGQMAWTERMGGHHKSGSRKAGGAYPMTTGLLGKG